MNKNRLISRQDAAEILQCDQQTISNWVEVGIIKGHMVNRRLMVDSKTIEAILDTAHDANQAKTRIEAIKRDLLKEEHELQLKINDTRNALRLWKHTSIGYIGREAAYNMLLSYQPLFSETELSIIKSLIEVGDISAVAANYGLSSTRIAQIACKVVRKIRNAKRYGTLLDEVDRLEEENKNLKNQLLLAGEKVEIEKIVEKSVLLSKNIVDLPFTVRTINVMQRAEIQTVGDMMSFKKSELLRFRNMGKKTLRELEEFADKYGLEFGMKVPDSLHSETFLYNQKHR